VTFAQAFVDAARADLGRGEDPPGSNAGPYVEMLGAPWGLSSPFNYCSAGVAHWLDVAEHASGIPKPIAGSTLALMQKPQLQAAGLWVDIDEVRRQLALGKRPAPGAILVFTRKRLGVPEGAGHTGVLESYRADTPIDIEANHTSVVSRVDRFWNDPSLIGVGLLGGWENATSITLPPELVTKPSSNGLVLVVGVAMGWMGVRWWKQRRRK
jgi:hypothetical protein